MLEGEGRASEWIGSARAQASNDEPRWVIDASKDPSNRKRFSSGVSGMGEPQMQAESEREAEPSMPEAALVEDHGAAEKSAKRRCKARTHRPIVESSHIRTMAASYKHHIALYSKDREQVNQIIPSAVWKGVYAQYLKQFPNSPFVEETLKDRLRETVKEIHAGKYVEEEPEQAPSQSVEVVARLKDRLRETLKEMRTGTFSEEDFEKDFEKGDEVFEDFEKALLKTSLRTSSDDPAGRRVLKRKLSLADQTTPVLILSRRNPFEADAVPRNPLEAADVAPAFNCIPGSMPPSATSGPSSMPSPHLSSTSLPVEKVVTEVEILQQLFRSIAAIAAQFLTNSEKRDALLAVEMDYTRVKSDYYNEKTRKLKIGNLKLLKEAGALSEEEFKQQVKLV